MNIVYFCKASLLDCSDRGLVDGVLYGRFDEGTVGVPTLAPTAGSAALGDVEFLFFARSRRAFLRLIARFWMDI